MTTTTVQRVTQLRYQDHDGVVVVTPDDQDRFAITVNEAIHACRVHQRVEIFGHQFNILVKRLAEWLHAHKDHISDAFPGDSDWNPHLIERLCREAEIRRAVLHREPVESNAVTVLHAHR